MPRKRKKEKEVPFDELPLFEKIARHGRWYVWAGKQDTLDKFFKKHVTKKGE